MKTNLLNLNMHIVSLLYLSVCLYVRNADGQWHRTIHQKVQQDPELRGFSLLIRNNSVANWNLHDDELTVFAPENKAFRNRRAALYPELAFYHMTFKAVALQELNSSVNSLTTATAEYPPLWISRVNGDVFVNNAKVLQSRSNFVFRSRHSDEGKRQILHVIDGVLDPLIRSPQFPPSAYDFISNSLKWNLGPSKSVSNFHTKVQETNVQYVFKQNAGHTFFVPLDSGVDAYKFKKLNKHIIMGHVVPFYVLFTGPTEKDFAYESLANDDYLYVVLSFVEKDRKLFVKGTARGALANGNEREEFYSEVVVPNIPVNNGVVHLISQPLALFNRPLKPFPYLPILTKISTDPSVDMFYKMGEVTEFNKIFERDDTAFTYFVPRDSAFVKTRQMFLDAVDDDLTILKRHLVLAPAPYSIEQLESLTKTSNSTYLDLTSEGGPLTIMVLRIDGEYYVKWHQKYIKVVRPNYECTNGIVHVLAGPMANFRRSKVPGERNVSSDIYDGYWRVVWKTWKKIAD